MRFIEILLEYKRDITKQKLGDRLVAAAQRDRTQDIDTILTSLEAMDPTTNKQYVLWLANQYIQGQFKLEDVVKVKDALEKFIKAKSRLPEKDIGRYTFYSLEDAMDKIYNVELKPQQSTDEPKTFDVPQDVKVLYNGPLGLLVIPKTEKASCELGSGTKWCTASRKNNMFAEYNAQAPLYIWRDKNGEKYQFHFGGEIQLMNARDRPITKELVNQFRTQHPVLKQLFKKEETKIARDPSHTYQYALDFIKGRWSEGEKAIARDPKLAWLYARNVIRGRFPEAEKFIAQDALYAFHYAKDVIRGRFPSVKVEKEIAQQPRLAYWYARYVIKGRFPEGEKVIARNPELAYDYAANAIKKRFPEGEKGIARDPELAYLYARYVIKGRWPKGEEAIARALKVAYKYARFVIRGRFPEAESAMRRDPSVLKDYTKFLRTKGITGFPPPKKKVKKKAKKKATRR